MPPKSLRKLMKSGKKGYIRKYNNAGISENKLKMRINDLPFNSTGTKQSKIRIFVFIAGKILKHNTPMKPEEAKLAGTSQYRLIPYKPIRANCSPVKIKSLVYALIRYKAIKNLLP